MYVVHAGELTHKYGSHDIAAGAAAGRDGAGTLIGCFVNVSTGFLTFTLNGRELPNKFQVGYYIMQHYGDTKVKVTCNKELN